MGDQACDQDDTGDIGGETQDERHRRYSDLFHRLDRDRDGSLNVEELTQSLEELQVTSTPGEFAQRLVARSDSNGDGKVDLGEFMDYICEHEKKLFLSFKTMDVNKDGHVDVEEMMSTFNRLGIQIQRHEAEILLKRMDKDKTQKISWEEWRNFLLLHTVTDLHDIIGLWRRATLIDIGEDLAVPDDFTEEELKTGMWWRHLLAGGTAGAVSRTSTAPLDRIKVFLQVHGLKHKDMGVRGALTQLLKEGGARGMWRGNGTNVLKIAPESALKFMAYEQFKKIIRGDDSRAIQPHERFVAGAAAGAVAQSTIYPMEVLKTRLALRKTGQYSGLFDCARHILRTEGIFSFYRGYVPNLLGIVPYAGIDLMIYESLKNLYISKTRCGDSFFSSSQSQPTCPESQQQTQPSVLVLLLCGTTSSTCGQLASYPLALVRTRLQAQAAAGGSSPKDSWWGQMKYIAKKEGIRGLYRGIIPNFLKVAPAVSISYVVYENIRQALGIKMT